ncbi:MAG TPA: hypothetical protein V6C97_15785 [Oculatellaceae cyanobacterium]
MSDTNDSELGRNKNSATPAEHLMHLLGLGWDPISPLIQKYVLDNHLQRELSDWQKVSAQAESQKASSKSK